MAEAATKQPKTTYLDLDGRTIRCKPIFTTTCAQCGMGLYDAREFHPFAACLMFEARHDSKQVRANLQLVYECGRKAAAHA